MDLRSGVFVFALLTAACPSRVGAQQAVYLVRHADKAGEVLSETGIAQAATLACLLKDAGITAVYVSDIDRTVQTAAPLRALLTAKGVAVRVHTIPLKALRDDATNPSLQDAYAGTVVDHVKAHHPRDIVLIVGHDNTVPAVIRTLGYRPRVTIRSTEFDHLFLVTPRAGDQPPAFLHIRHYSD
jgi:broad specificity phosphatase PhoE